ncbi:Precorrin-2 C(20)-methyltransferase [Candidatus Hodgkinia cicadicola]|nr:Precorrin-2 C(20)-methyltransferase [Candidatus Hodgkinia cicadicola]
MLNPAGAFVWFVYLNSYCVCKAFLLSKVCLEFGTQMPMFLALINSDLFESWKTCLCYLLSLGRDVICTSLGSIKVFSSALKLFNSLCRYYRFKLVSGTSIVNIAELFKTDGLVGFGKRVGLEWLLCLSVCVNSILVLKVSVLNLIALRFLFKALRRGLWFKFAASRNERIRVVPNTLQLTRYFETAWVF